MNTILFILAFIQCTTNAIEIQNDKDTVFLFSGEIGLKTEDGSSIDWFAANDTTHSLASGVSELYPDAGQGIAVKHNGRWERYFVLQLDTTTYSMTVTPECHTTRITLSNPIPTLSYKDREGLSKTLTRTATFQYNNLVWQDENGWTSVPQSTTANANGANYLLPCLYEATNITMITDSAWRSELGMAENETIGSIEQPIAFAIHPTHTTTTRWEGQDQMNEIEPPSKADFLSGSGPLDILFRSNPTPTTEWFTWDIYKGSTLLFSRRDQDQRYVFDEGGNYTVTITASNSTCQCEDKDSTCYAEFAIHIAESYLNVPNVFTPNGDGANDEFRVDYKSIVEYHIWVYNRWNKLVYESTNPMEGWDGNIGGRPAAEGAYFYVIRAKGTDAIKDADYISKIRYDKKRKSAKPEEVQSVLGIYQLSGDINLLR